LKINLQKILTSRQFSTLSEKKYIHFKFHRKNCKILKSSLEQQFWEMLSPEIILSNLLLRIRPSLKTFPGLKRLQVVPRAFQRFPELLRKTASSTTKQTKQKNIPRFERCFWNPKLEIIILTF
jgi:hypothetical protein